MNVKGMAFIYFFSPFAAQSIFINHSFPSNFPSIAAFSSNAEGENVKLVQLRHHKIISQEWT